MLAGGWGGGIEHILDVQRGAFPNWRTSYLVKWRGCGEEHNIWVDEGDAGNAQGLIDEYWDAKKKRIRGHKSVSSASKLAAAKGRKPVPSKESPELDDTHPKKRGRSSKSTKDEEEEQDEQKQSTHQAKKIKITKSKLSKSNNMSNSDIELIDMRAKFGSATTWEHLVDHIDTVMHDDDDQLYVYFTLKNKARANETARVCKDKMPQKLLDFYEKNLQWRTIEEDDINQG
ncbi:hypothetical protein WOLCODRAFT_154664 [Wolfiporia cocos MD-104 SS10]|uniref:Chromo domain-containing protein n=1 Tax=Wolfiporia cocos (strain MD-104) TaxID=742152 RepID=A0A2H3JR54_WOLCO|nr:hypothetical protein WOLCODRAFT_154664 [Wolfiporia cocos MD-104 SS10]